jgi:hypothetical protein
VKKCSNDDVVLRSANDIVIATTIFFMFAKTRWDNITTSIRVELAFVRLEEIKMSLENMNDILNIRTYV